MPKFRTKEDKSVEQMTSSLSARDYLTAVLQEHQTLRDEIKLRINMRNGSMVGFGTCAVVVIGRILFTEQPLTASLSVRIMLLVILPTIWFFIFTIQVILMAQVDRAARVLAIIEQKVQLIFELAGEESVKNAIERIEIKLQSELPKHQKPDVNFWSDPMLWERFLRSQKHRRMTRLRWWDSPWRRNIPCFIAATLISSSGPVILAATGSLKWSFGIVWVGAYLVIAIVLVLFSTRSTFVGPTATPRIEKPGKNDQ